MAGDRVVAAGLILAVLTSSACLAQSAVRSTAASDMNFAYMPPKLAVAGPPSQAGVKRPEPTKGRLPDLQLGMRGGKIVRDICIGCNP
ncbi:conserved hypothetical protein [Methylobacterium nodulans ORS 2060]|uniref:Uncharacterized protein n=1 Tax=Methylobacterium nodulans (strain LMG 21967 / CNCM I-2342 / ORS 2060) TaxID=460265 RepID=B8IQG3_METNO|nr:conserved hypothetical protein [Methylobacterium nodulans ORS 2060]